ncbi:MAG: NADPH-dependent 7-cyano-7-deazaguanine reductase QueF [Legionella sp.]|nr:NADPH-dependent 7-cyano-7-deazaguanine reductase QueF [Legionella sp.]
MALTPETDTTLLNAPLGKSANYVDQYDPSLLFPIPREVKRKEIQVTDPIPFYGYDTWNAYEVSWLNESGKPAVAIARIDIDAASKNIVESKSFKLYLNSFNNSRFTSTEAVKTTLINDLERVSEGKINLEIFPLDYFIHQKIETFEGDCLDSLDVTCDFVNINTNALSVEDGIVTEVLYSNLLKSNCLVTGQPDWGSIQISYHGPKINRENLLKYLVSFRNHNEFHEQCVERIFMDLSKQCRPNQLTVKARYTRRGGLDINPTRSSSPIALDNNIRMARQ